MRLSDKGAVVASILIGAADDRLGIPIGIDADRIDYAYPVAILAATRPA